MKSPLLPDCLNRWLRSLSALADFPTVFSDVDAADAAVLGGVNEADFVDSGTILRP
jgi:hypothetical protein